MWKKLSLGIVVLSFLMVTGCGFWKDVKEAKYDHPVFHELIHSSIAAGVYRILDEVHAGNKGLDVASEVMGYISNAASADGSINWDEIHRVIESYVPAAYQDTAYRIKAIVEFEIDKALDEGADGKTIVKIFNAAVDGGYDGIKAYRASKV